MKEQIGYDLLFCHIEKLHQRGGRLTETDRIKYYSGKLNRKHLIDMSFLAAASAKKKEPYRKENERYKI